jgi:hypothetical protein
MTTLKQFLNRRAYRKIGKPFTVNVTAEHIANGQRAVAAACPVAIALSEQTGLPVRVGIHTAIGESYTSRHAELPLKAVRWIERFDYDQPVEPFSFELTWEKY